MNIKILIIELNFCGYITLTFASLL